MGGLSNGEYTSIVISGAAADATSDDLSSWNFVDPKITYTVSVDGEELKSFEKSGGSGTVAYAAMMSAVNDSSTIADLHISAGKHTITVDVVVTFKGTDGKTYTLAGSATDKTV